MTKKELAKTVFMYQIKFEVYPGITLKAEVKRPDDIDELHCGFCPDGWRFESRNSPNGVVVANALNSFFDEDEIDRAIHMFNLQTRFDSAMEAAKTAFEAIK